MSLLFCGITVTYKVIYSSASSTTDVKMVGELYSKKRRASA
ncbi:unnamed protein product [Amoebophrya sp. A25]|nr:unnamed protein product [Amoebophrya sp. A25]|eukprot:GSA25T00023698001.1